MTNNPNAFVSVPREPTEEIIRAVDKALHKHWPDARKMAIAVHESYVAAAPSAPVVSGEEWLPIETAPFGEVVLICNPDKGRLQCVAVYSKTANIWRVANTLTPIDVPPTHWRPLPAPPVESAALKQGGDRG